MVAKDLEREDLEVARQSFLNSRADSVVRRLYDEGLEGDFLAGVHEAYSSTRRELEPIKDSQKLIRETLSQCSGLLNNFKAIVDGRLLGKQFTSNDQARRLGDKWGWYLALIRFGVCSPQSADISNRAFREYATIISGTLKEGFWSAEGAAYYAGFDRLPVSKWISRLANALPPEQKVFVLNLAPERY